MSIGINFTVFLKKIDKFIDSIENNKNKELFFVFLFLSGLVLIFLHDIFFNGKVLISADFPSYIHPWATVYPFNTMSIPHNPLQSDVYEAYYPFYFYIFDSVKQGVYPLWSPYQLIGVPLEYSTGLYNPVNILFYFFPTKYAYGYTIALQLVLGGFFMYLFARYLKINKSGSLIASIIFMFNGDSIGWLEHVAHFKTALFIPLVFLFYMKALNDRSTVSLLISGIVGGLAIFGGYLQTIVHLFAFLGFYTVFHIIIGNKGTKFNIKTIAIPSGYLLFLFIITILVSAVSTFPYFGSFMSSLNSEESGFGGSYALSPDQYITFLIPNFYGNPVQHYYFGYFNFIELVDYVGILPILLSLIALLLIKNEEKIYFFSISLLFIFLVVSWGSFAQIVSSIVPYFTQSVSLRLLSFAPFFIAILSGYGWTYLCRMEEEFHKQRALKALSAIILAVLVFGIYSVIKQYKLIVDNNFLKYEIIAISFFFVLFFISILIIYFNIKFDKNKHNFIAIIAILLLIFDLFSFGIDFNTKVDPTIVYPETESIRFLKNDTDVFRVTSPERSTLIPNSAQIYNLQDIRAHGLNPERYSEFLGIINKGWKFLENHNILLINNVESNLIDLLNVKYIISSNYLIDIDQQQLIRNGVTWFGTHDAQKIAQTFTANHSIIDRIVFSMSMGSRKDDLKVSIQTTKNGSPSGKILNYTIIENSKINGSNLPIDLKVTGLVTGERYAIVFEPGNGFIDDSKPIIARRDYNQNEYRGGNFWRFNGNKWIESPFDLFFTTIAGGNSSQNKLELVYDKEVRIYRNNLAYPRAFMVYKTKVIEEDKILDELRTDTFNPKEYVILEEKPESFDVNPLAKSAKASVSIVKYAPNEVILHVYTSESGFLVMSDAYSSGWEVYVDGNKNKIYRGNYIMRAVLLQKGEHLVKFEYRPLLFRIGLVVSIATLSFIIFYCIIKKSRKKLS